MKLDKQIIAKITTFAIAMSLLAPIAAFAEQGENDQGIKARIYASSTASSTKGVKDIKDKMMEKKENIKERIASSTEEMRNKMEERKNQAEKRKDEMRDKIRERISNFMDNMIKRYNAAIGRLDKLATRIDSRIKKLEAEGIDETVSKDLLVTAKAKIEIAKISVSTIANVASTTTASTTDLKTSFPGLKSALEKAKKDIMAAHRALIDVVKNIKPGRNKDDKHATTTPATTSTSTATTTSN